MRIFDKKTDYYDGICKSFQDDLTWERQEWNYPLYDSKGRMTSNIPFYIPCNVRNWNEEFIIKNNISDSNAWQFSVIFAGKIYHGIELYLRDGIHHIYDMKSLEKLIPLDDKSPRGYTFYENNYIPMRILWESNDLSKDQLEFCVERKIVVGVLKWNTMSKRIEFTCNGSSLKELEFFKKVDTYMAYQELYMYIGGVLPRSSNSIIELEDKYKIQKAGFDLKSSFRHRTKE